MEPDVKKSRILKRRGLFHLKRGSSRRVRVVLCGAGSWAQGWHLPQLQRKLAATF